MTYRKKIWAAAMAMMLAASQAFAVSVSHSPDQRGGNAYDGVFLYPQGKEPPENRPDRGGQIGETEVTETQLMSMLSARSVQRGTELSLHYDLQLAPADYEMVSVIEKGTTLEYQLLREISEDEDPEVVLSGSVSFSMNRSQNDRCILTITPEADQTCVMKVRARMIFADGTELENLSDSFLVYTQTEILTHLDAQDCEAGEEIQLDVMVRGAEGVYTFQVYRAISMDNGANYTREEAPMDVFLLDSHSQKPDMKRTLPVTAVDNCMLRFDLIVQTPDLSTVQVSSDPVRVKVREGAGQRI